jgi:hypothetical protein
MSDAVSEVPAVVAEEAVPAVEAVPELVVAPASETVPAVNVETVPAVNVETVTAGNAEEGKADAAVDEVAGCSAAQIDEPKAESAANEGADEGTDTLVRMIIRVLSTTILNVESARGSYAPDEVSMQTVPHVTPALAGPRVETRRRGNTMHIHTTISTMT